MSAAVMEHNLSGSEFGGKKKRRKKRTAEAEEPSAGEEGVSYQEAFEAFLREALQERLARFYDPNSVSRSERKKIRRSLERVAAAKGAELFGTETPRDRSRQGTETSGTSSRSTSAAEAAQTAEASATTPKSKKKSGRSAAPEQSLSEAEFCSPDPVEEKKSSKSKKTNSGQSEGPEQSLTEAEFCSPGPVEKKKTPKSKKKNSGQSEGPEQSLSEAEFCSPDPVEKKQEDNPASMMLKRSSFFTQVVLKNKKKHRRGSPLQKSHCETEASADVIEQSPKSKKSGGERDPPDLPVPPDPRSKSKMKDLASEGDFVEAANTLPECPVLDDSIMDSNDSIPCGQADPDKVQKPDQPAIPEAMPPPVQIPVKILPSPRKGLKVLRPPTPPASSSADSADSDEEEEEEEGEQEEDESETEIEDVDLSSDDEYQFAPTATNPKMARCGSTSSTEKDEKSMKERRKKMYKKNPLRFWTSLQKELFTGVLGTDAKVSIRVPRICPVRGCGNLEDSPNKLFDHLIEKHLKTVRAFGEFPMSRRVENRSCAGPRVHSKEELDIGLKLLLVQHGLTSDQVQAVRSLIVDTCLGHLTTYGDEGSRPYRTVREMDVDVQSAAARQRIRYKTVVDHDLARKAKKAKV